MIDNPKGYLFLDIDGVINPLADVKQPGWWRADVGTGRGVFRIWVSEPLSMWLNGLLDQGIQIVWATTWITDPEALADLAGEWRLPLNLPRIGRVDVWADADEYRYDSGKRTGVREYVEANSIDPDVTPVVWIDDMIGPGDETWAESIGIVTYSVPEKIGLSTEHNRNTVVEALGLMVTDT